MSQLEALFGARFPQPSAPADLVRRGAGGLAALLTTGRYDGARLIRCARRDDGAELLQVEAVIAIGQREPVNYIREVEPVAIVFFADDRLPQAYPLRDDFPDVSHLNISREGEPRSLCLFEMPDDEAARIATPFVFVERVRWWLLETAHGRLHGEDQPLDPVFAGSRLKVVLPPGGVVRDEVLFGYRRSEQADFPILLQKPDVGLRRQAVGMPRFACLALTTPAVPHGRLRALPSSLASLFAAYESLGVDLLTQVRGALGRWAGDAQLKTLLAEQALLVVSTPVERTPGEVDGVATKGFFVDCKVVEMGEALGAMTRDPDGKVGLLLGSPEVDRDALSRIAVEAVDLHRGFDRALARAASGYAVEPDAGEVLLVGAGALGSQIATDAARGGLGRWTVVDPDHLMPHNLARHALTAADVGVAKAEALAGEIGALLGPTEARAIPADIRSVGSEDPAFAEADLVIDASASVPTARWLACESRHTAPCASVFLSPAGSDLVVLREGAGRTPRLDHLEMTYYWLLASDPALTGHLETAGAIMPSGGCRNPSVQLPQTRVAAHAALAVDEVFQDKSGAGGIVLWRRTELGLLRFTGSAEPFVEVEIDGWIVAVRPAVIRGAVDARKAAGALETGGILVGTWDRQRRRAWIVAHLDPPPDSEHSASGFVRGTVGVYQALDHIEAATAVNLTYVGEWHTHPPGHRSLPSEDDRLLMRWIGDVVAFSDVPPIMMIAGEDGVRLMLGSVRAAAMLPDIATADGVSRADVQAAADVLASD